MERLSGGFPERLRVLRERRGKSQKVLGELCGLSKNVIGRYERGEGVPDIDTLRVLCSVLGVTADQLLGEK